MPNEPNEPRSCVECDRDARPEHRNYFCSATCAIDFAVNQAGQLDYCALHRTWFFGPCEACEGCETADEEESDA